MGHDAHFLTRLDRVTADQTELALSLYRDDELVHSLLAQLHLPEHAARVALSLDHPELGPFVLVARDGHFVTCLGRGMSPAPHPVVSRERLDALLSKLVDLRERLALARRLSGDDDANGLIRRIFHAGPMLSREEIRALEAVSPLLVHELVRIFVEVAQKLWATQTHASRAKVRARRRNDDFLDAYWKGLWALSHLAVLIGAHGREYFDSLEPEAERLRTVLTEVTVPFGLAGLSLRSLWAAGKLGKPLLGAYKRSYEEASNVTRLFASAAALAVIGTRHARLRAEALKVLAGHVGPGLPAELREVLRSYHRAMAQDVERQLADPDAPTRAVRELGARLLLKLASQRRAERWRHLVWEDVPEDLALPALTLTSSDMTAEKGESILFGCLPWLAHASSDELYLPKTVLREVAPAYSSAVVAAIAERHRKPAPPRAAAPRAPARNEPCSCGSGRKYKRCCAA